MGWTYMPEAEDETDFQKIYKQLWVKLEKMHKKKSKPYRFLWCLGHFSENFDPKKFLTYDEDYWIGILEQWDIPDTSCDVVQIGYSGNCCCSKEIQNFFYIYNYENDNILRVGSVCVDNPKYMQMIGSRFSDACNKMGDKLKTKNTEFMYSKNHVDCIQCGAHTVPKNKEEQICTECIKKKNLRPCITCTQHKIKVTEPSYVSQCKECYKIYRLQEHKPNNLSDELKKEYYRECTQCKEYNVLKTAELWKKTCFDCYKNNKSDDD